MLWSVKGKTDAKKEEGAVNGAGGKPGAAGGKKKKGPGGPITVDKFGVPIPPAAQMEEPDLDEPP